MQRTDTGSRIAKETRDKYSGATYCADRICHEENPCSADYFDRLLACKLNLVRANVQGGVILDLCCATGVHLLSLVPLMRQGIGLDFSRSFLAKAKELLATAGYGNIAYIEGNACVLPFSNNSFDFVYVFSSLYHIPKAEEVTGEIARVLRPGGKCLLDMGNRYSLNTVVCRAYRDLAQPCHVPVGEMKKNIRAAGLCVLQHRAFQILPLWGERPGWLRPLLHPAWKKLLQKQFRTRMLDEWLCSLPVVKQLAFRHIFLCKKGAVVNDAC